jgi:chromosome segregation ATPase
VDISFIRMVIDKMQNSGKDLAGADIEQLILNLEHENEITYKINMTILSNSKNKKTRLEELTRKKEDLFEKRKNILTSYGIEPF